MGVSTARKTGPKEEQFEHPADKRKRGLRLLMAAIWRRHNGPDPSVAGNDDEDKRKSYLAEIW